MTPSEHYAKAMESEKTQAVERLVALAEELGIEDIDLDLLVYDASNEVASDRVNSGEYDEEDETWDEMYERLHDEADAAASDINNGGIHSQLSYLLDGYSEEALAQILRDAIGDRPC